VASFNEAIQAYHGGRMNEAGASFSKAVQHKPDFAPAYRNRCLAYVQLGEKDRALADAKEAVRLAPHDPNAFLTLGLVHTILDDAPAAVDAFYRVLQLRPNDPQAQEQFHDLIFQDIGPFKEWLSSGAPKAAVQNRTTLDTVLSYLGFSIGSEVVLADIPGDRRPLRPVGGMPINVLHYVIVDEKGKTVTFLGYYDPRFPTGPVPYFELLQTACKMMPRWAMEPHAGPGFDLDPLPGEMERVMQTLTAGWVNAAFRKAGEDPGAREMLTLLQANLGWSGGEAACHIDGLFGKYGEKVRLAETMRFFTQVRPVLQKRRLWLPPGFLAKFGGLAPKVACKFENVPTDSQLARVMFQADFCLKYSAEWMPLERYIPGYVTFSQFCRTRGLAMGANERFRKTWKPDSIRLNCVQNGDQTVVEFTETRLRVEMAHLPGAQSNVSENDLEDYSRLYNQHLGEIACWCPAFHELQESVKILSLARYMQQRGLALQFPEKTWHPWNGPNQVDGILSVDVYEEPGKTRLHTSVNGGTDLRNLADKVVFDSQGSPLLAHLSDYVHSVPMPTNLKDITPATGPIYKTQPYSSNSERRFPAAERVYLSQLPEFPSPATGASSAPQMVPPGSGGSTLDAGHNKNWGYKGARVYQDMSNMVDSMFAPKVKVPDAIEPLQRLAIAALGEFEEELPPDDDPVIKTLNDVSDVRGRLDWLADRIMAGATQTPSNGRDGAGMADSYDAVIKASFEKFTSDAVNYLVEGASKPICAAMGLVRGGIGDVLVAEVAAKVLTSEVTDKLVHAATNGVWNTPLVLEHFAEDPNHSPSPPLETETPAK
jgi:hypothetical protein